MPLKHFENIDLSQPDTVVSALRSLVNSGWLGAYFSDRLGHLDRDRNYIPNMDSDQAVLLRNNVFSLTLKFFDLNSFAQKEFPNDPRLIVSANDIYWWNIDTGKVRYRLYHTESQYIQDNFDQAATLVCLGEFELKNNDFLRLEAGRHAIEVLEMESSGVWIEVASMPQSSLVGYFEKSKLKAFYCAAAHIDASRTMHKMDALMALQGFIGEEVRDNLISRREHFIRWEVLKLVFSQDYQWSKAKLEEFLGDPHPSIRSAAIKNLDVILEAHHV